jgi:RNA polymerase sigma-70 factor (ECF subfamily)
MTATDSDEALMAAYVAGEDAAFAILFKRHAPVLIGMMRRHVRREEEANDLLQQTFLQLHRARHDFRPGSMLRPWLYTIAMNCIREHFRRLGRRKESELTPDVESTLTADDPSLESLEEARLARDRLLAALAQLPQNQREVIEMHWFQGRPFQEVAQILGASLSAVKVRAHRGYTLLRKTLVTTPPVAHKENKGT